MAASRSCKQALAPPPARRARSLTREQKREFALGWLNWLGAESIGVVVAILNLVWVPVVAFAGIAIPDKILTIPILAAFVVSLVHFVALYRLRVRDPARPDGRRGVRRHVGAVDGGARGRLRHLEGRACPSCAPPRAAPPRKGPDFPAFWEARAGGAAADRRRARGR